MSRLWVGIGCMRGTSKELIEAAIHQVFLSQNLPEIAIAGIATIDTKAHEVGLLEFCRDRNLPLKIFSAQTLRSLSVNNANRVVEEAVGSPSVAEAAAIAASGSPILLVPKQIFRSELRQGAVTIALSAT